MLVKKKLKNKNKKKLIKIGKYASFVITDQNSYSFGRNKNVKNKILILNQKNLKNL
jgi:hypothetical protein